MARYIKANPKVAQFLNLQNDRLSVNDGNYILWQADMLAFGPLTRLSETLTAIGAIALMPHEAREEQDGTKLRPLPTATDPRFEVPAPAPTVTPEPEIPTGPIEDDASGKNPDESAEQLGGENEPTEAPGTGDTPSEGDTPDEATVEPQVKTTAKRTAKKTTV